MDGVEEISRWATGGLVPDLTVVLDIDPEVGLRRLHAPADRLESEPLDFHRRVRESFLDLSRRAAERYLVVDAARPADDIAVEVLAAVKGRLT
jgi:dTMP kinase